MAGNGVLILALESRQKREQQPFCQEASGCVSAFVFPSHWWLDGRTDIKNHLPNLQVFCSRRGRRTRGDMADPGLPEGWQWLIEQMIKFWWRSGSQIRIGITTLVRRVLAEVCTVPVLLVMVALWNRAGHYIFPLWFFFLLSSFFPRLISAVANWMYTILPHMVWP